jgi:hypothetical protein
LDERGILPSDSCVVIATPTTSEAQNTFKQFALELEALVDRPLAHRDLLLFALAFLNSTAAAFLLRIGREPTPKGSWNVNEDYLSLIKLPIPERDTASRLLDLSKSFVDDQAGTVVTPELAAELDRLVFHAYGLADSDVERAVMSWATGVPADDR